VTCDELRAIAAELALDHVTGAERAAALGHLATCVGCRALVTDLAAVADSVLLLAPEVEPPEGFESRVLDRFELVEPARRAPWIAAVAAAAVAAIVGGIAGFTLATANDGADGLPLALALRSASGASAGNVLLADDPDRMTCVFEDERFGGAYSVEVVLEDGSVAQVGAFEAEGAPWSWTVALPVDAADVRTVRVLDDDGVLRASADAD
jgi:hypothetical protein